MFYLHCTKCSSLFGNELNHQSCLLTLIWEQLPPHQLIGLRDLSSLSHTRTRTRLPACLRFGAAASVRGECRTGILLLFLKSSFTQDLREEETCIFWNLRHLLPTWRFCCALLRTTWPNRAAWRRRSRENFRPSGGHLQWVTCVIDVNQSVRADSCAGNVFSGQNEKVQTRNMQQFFPSFSCINVSSSERFHVASSELIVVNIVTEAEIRFVKR